MLNWKALFLSGFLLSATIPAPAQLDLGDRLISSQIPEKNNLECAATPSQTYPCIKDLVVNGVRFSTVGYDAKTKRVKYLSTSDVKFKTKDGLRVGDWIDVSEDQVTAYPGGFIYGPKTEDGWHVVLGNTLVRNGEVHFQDGIAIDPNASRTGSLRTGKVRILEFDKGGL